MQHASALFRGDHSRAATNAKCRIKAKGRMSDQVRRFHDIPQAPGCRPCSRLACVRGNRGPCPAGRRRRQRRADHGARYRAAQQAHSIVDPQGAVAPGGHRRAHQREAQGARGQDDGASTSLPARSTAPTPPWRAACAYTPEQLTQGLAKAASTSRPSKRRIKADIAWPQLVRGRYQSMPADRRRRTCSPPWKTKSDDAVGYDYTLRPILFSCRPARRKPSSRGASARRRPCAAAFRAARKASSSRAPSRTSPCATRSFAARPTFPPSCARVLDGIEVGRLTAPEVTKFGIEMFAICAKKESSADNTPGKRKARESVIRRAFRATIQAVPAGITAQRDDRIQVKERRAMPRPLALTLGEPAGIGPDITFAAWRRRAELDLPPFYLLADPQFRRAARRADRARRADCRGRAGGRRRGVRDARCRSSTSACRSPRSRAIPIDRAHRRRSRRSVARWPTSAPGGERDRHQSGRQERALSLGLRRARPHRVSRQAGRGT